MIATPYNHAAELALSIYRDVLTGVSGDRLMRDSVKVEGSHIHIQDKRLDLDSFADVYVCGAGKASFGMARSLVEMLGPRVSGGLVITKEGHGGELPGIEVIESSHPVLDERSIEAGGRMLEFASRTGPDDLVLFALSGGASALMEFPVEGVTLAQLQVLNRRLLDEGFNIHEINRLRTLLSQIKGGKLGLTFASSRVAVLVLSDVMADRLDIIGSGPFWNGASDEWIPRGAGPYWEKDEQFRYSYHRHRGLALDAVAPRFGAPQMFSIIEELGLAGPATASPLPPVRLDRVFHRFIGSSMTACTLAQRSADNLGLTVFNLGRSSSQDDNFGAPAPTSLSPEVEPIHCAGIFSRLKSIRSDLPTLEGDVRAEARRVATTARDLLGDRANFALFFGEPTVVIRGGGTGGRCQELACVAAPLIAGMEGIAILAGSTDGTDGPTDVAGALIDGRSVARAAEKGVTPESALATSDSHSFLAACGGLIYTGPTQSNVNDIVIVVKARGLGARNVNSSQAAI